MSKLALDLSVYDCLNEIMPKHHDEIVALVRKAIRDGDSRILDMDGLDDVLTEGEQERVEKGLIRHNNMLLVRSGKMSDERIRTDDLRKYWTNDWPAMGVLDDGLHLFNRVFVTGKSRTKLLKLMRPYFIKVDLSGAMRSEGFGADTGRVVMNTKNTPMSVEREIFMTEYRPVVEEVVKRFGKANAEAVAVKSPDVRKHTDTLIDFLDPDGTGLRGDDLVEHYKKEQGYRHLSKRWRQIVIYSREVFKEFDNGQSFVTAANKRYKPRSAQK